MNYSEMIVIRVYQDGYVECSEADPNHATQQGWGSSSAHGDCAVQYCKRSMKSKYTKKLINLQLKSLTKQMAEINGKIGELHKLYDKIDKHKEDF